MNDRPRPGPAYRPLSTLGGTYPADADEDAKMFHQHRFSTGARVQSSDTAVWRKNGFFSTPPCYHRVTPN